MLEPTTAQRLHTSHEISFKNAQAFKNRLPAGFEAKCDEEILKTVESGLHPYAKLAKIYEIVGRLDKWKTGVTPCKRGCSGCCHMNVQISGIEARYIERKTRHKAVALTDSIQHDITEFEGQACPFLKDRACSIYEHRPHACRMHMTFDADSYWCQPGRLNQATLAFVNSKEVALAVAMLEIEQVGNERACGADIRDFFPKA